MAQRRIGVREMKSFKERLSKAQEEWASKQEIIHGALKKEDFDISAWPDDWEKVKSKLDVGVPVIMRCTVKEWNEVKSLNLEEVISIWKEK